MEVKWVSFDHVQTFRLEFFACQTPLLNHWRLGDDRQQPGTYLCVTFHFIPFQYYFLQWKERKVDTFHRRFGHHIPDTYTSQNTHWSLKHFVTDVVQTSFGWWKSILKLNISHIALAVGIVRVNISAAKAKSRYTVEFHISSVALVCNSMDFTMHRLQSSILTHDIEDGALNERTELEKQADEPNCRKQLSNNNLLLTKSSSSAVSPL